MLKIILDVTGFIVGGLLCAGFVFKIIGNHPVIALIAGVVGGALGSALMIGLFVFGVFILSGVLGLIVGEVISICIFGLQSFLLLLFCIFVGIAENIFQYKFTATSAEPEW
jgi:hypothetical protein